MGYILKFRNIDSKENLWYNMNRSINRKNGGAHYDRAENDKGVTGLSG